MRAFRGGLFSVVVLAAVAVVACDVAPLTPPIASVSDKAVQSSGPPAATGAYELVALDVGDLAFQVLDINNAEQVSIDVCCGPNQEQEQAAIWQSGVLTKLGAPGPDTRPGYDSRGFSVGFSINNQGAVAGFGSVYLETHAFIWRPGSGFQDLGRLPNGTYSLGYGINDGETVVGAADTPSGVRAFRWTASQGMIELSTLPGFDAYVYAVAVNGDGVAVGVGYSASGESRALRWTPDGAVADLGSLGGTSSYAVGIAGDGTIAGVSTISDGSYHAFRWTITGGMERLDPGALFSQARDVSRAGVMGSENRGPMTKDSTVSLGVVWTDPGNARVFRPPHVSAEGVAVNDAGVIAGWWNSMPVLWRPRSSPQP